LHGKARNSAWTFSPANQTRRSGFVLPIPPYLINRVAMGLYYDLVAAHAEAFSNTFGKVFEAYVGELLRDVYPADQIVSEQVYGRQHKLSSDWAVIEARSVTLLECKITRLRVATKVHGEAEVLSGDLARGVARAAKQLQSVVQAIEAHEAGLDPFFEAEAIVPVVVLLDPFFVANSAYVRELVATLLEAEGIRGFEYQVISIQDLEDYLPCRSRPRARKDTAAEDGGQRPTMAFNSVLGVRRVHRVRSARQ
jgi:hypothetical protein